MSATGSPQSGATLLEALVVLAIMAMISAIAFPNIARGLDRQALRYAARNVAADLGRARAQAVRGGAPVRFSVTPDGRVYGWTGSGPRPVSAPVTLGLAPDAVVFFPDGTATPARLRLRATDAEVLLAIDPVTGSASAP